MTSLNRGKKNNDIPTTIDKEKYEGSDEDPEYWCPYCHRNLTLVNRETGEYKCSIDEIPFYPREDDNVRRADILDIPEDPEDKEILISNTPDPLAGYYGPEKPEYQGAFKTLQDKGIHITSYTEKDGSGRIMNSWREGSNSSSGSGSGSDRKVSAPKPFRMSREED